MKRLKRIGELHKTAMRLRLQGFSYAEIGDNVNRSESTVKQWFQGDDLFIGSYREYQQQLTEQAEAQLIDAGDSAVKALISMLGARSEYVRLQAAQDILNRMGVSAPHRYEHSGPNGSPLQVHSEVTVNEFSNFADNPKARELHDQFLASLAVQPGSTGLSSEPGQVGTGQAPEAPEQQTD